MTTAISILSGCASTTLIHSKPEGAKVYIDNLSQGTTPLEYADTAIAGTEKPIRLEKDGYENLETVIRKDKFQVGPMIGGILILFPFVWILGYPETYEFELEPEKAHYRPIRRLPGESIKPHGARRESGSSESGSRFRPSLPNTDVYGTAASIRLYDMKRSR